MQTRTVANEYGGDYGPKLSVRCMSLTRDIKELVQKRVARDPAFGAALLREGVDMV